MKAFGKRVKRKEEGRDEIKARKQGSKEGIQIWLGSVGTTG